MRDPGQIIDEIFDDGVYKCVFSDPAEAGAYMRIAAVLKQNGYQLEKYTDKQVFHENLSAGEIREYAKTAFGSTFKQLNAWSEVHEHSVRISRKGKLSYSRNAAPPTSPKVSLQHNREKNYIIPQGSIVEPLIDMGIMTKNGGIVSSMYGKYRQINRFLEIIDDEIRKIELDRPLSILDLCCGKSYLTFVLYHYLTKIRNLRVDMLGLDLKEDVIENCNRTAHKYRYDGLSFRSRNINEYNHNGTLDIVVALHACDTATDTVLYNAIRWNARLIFSAPCCQHELNGQIQSDHFSILTRYGIVKERTAALMTDAIRADLLEYCGYRTQLLEFVDLEHTHKNILIRAVKTRNRGDERLLRDVESLMEEFHLNPTLYRLLKESF